MTGEPGQALVALDQEGHPVVPAATGAAGGAKNGAAEPPRMPRARVFLAAGLLVIALLAWGAYGHWQRSAAADATQRDMRDFVPTVQATRAKRVDTPVALTLPGQTQAFDAADIYPRATGYVVERDADIGSHVHRGDLLVRIAAPDTDQQLAQAEAQLGQYQAAILQAQANVSSAQANNKLADVTRYRETTLAQQGWETKQNADNSVANAGVQTAGVASAEAGIAVALANLKAQQAAVDRLRALTAFEYVRAPFDGVVTARNVDVGDLLSADSSGGSPMFSIESLDVLRVVVNVPQSAAIGIHDGLQAKIEVPQLPGQTFTGQVARSSVALLASSRTLSTQVDVPNPDGTLRPGLFVNVSFAIPRERPGIVVPSEALVFSAAGMQVAVIQPDDTIHLQTVSIYRDFGTSVELQSGLDGGEALVLNLPPDLGNGAKVKANAPPPQPAPGPDLAREAER